MRIALVLMALLLPVVGSHGHSDEVVVGTTGQFEYRISQIDLSSAPSRGYLQATLGFRITNTGKHPVRLAVVPRWPTVQLKGAGTHFEIRGGAISGVAYHNSAVIASCARAAENLTLLRPNQSLEASMVLDAYLGEKDLPPVKRARFSANLMVQSLEDKACWIEPFTVGEVPVVVNL